MAWHLVCLGVTTAGALYRLIVYGETSSLVAVGVGAAIGYAAAKLIRRRGWL